MAFRALYEVVAPAKLNLFLHVIGQRADGYHLLQSVLVLIDWYDTLHFELRDDGRIARHDLGTALPPEDLCLRAARALRAASGTSSGVDISIEKRVPSGAGMGGGSSDAASTLLALNRLWDLRWSSARLAALALGLGADVPFFVGASNALVEGIGERLTPLTLQPRWMAVVKPPSDLSTRAIFASALLGRSPEADIVEGFTAGGLSGAPSTPGDGWFYGRNDLQAAAEAECVEIAEALAMLQSSFGNSRMTGSGSAVFARAGSGARPDGQMPAELGAGWTGRMCRSLAGHPLTGWADF